MWVRRNSHSWLEGIQNGTATSKDNLEDSNKAEHTLSIQSSKVGLVFMQMNQKLTCTQKLAHKCNSDFICNSANTWMKDKDVLK